MKRTHWLALAAGLQLVVLAGEYLGSVWPAWTGERVTLRVQPVDPRSWFSGNYARLDYEIAMIPETSYRGDERRLREGEVVYVQLEPDGESWRAASVGLEPPAEGRFLRGRLQYSWHGYGDLRVRYGIEAWFAPKEEALAIEQSIAETGFRGGDFGGMSEEPGEAMPPRSVLAEVAVTSSGRAALVGLDWRRD